MNVAALPALFPVAAHTDFIGPHSIFVAIRGFDQDGALYIEKAIEQGAAKVLVQHGTTLSQATLLAIEKNNVVIEYVEDSRKALADFSAQYAGYPAKKLKIIGITGTKGKTTTAFLVEHILKSAGHKTALISSIKNSIAGCDFPPRLTTPQPDYMHQFLRVCVEHDTEYVVMEVAAQALTLHRVHGIEFDGVIFTNFSHEHLEFYDSLEDYFNAKCLIFNQLKNDAPVFVNVDNEYGVRIKNRKPECVGFGFGEKADIRAILRQSLPHVTIGIEMDNSLVNFSCPSLPGLYNAYNIEAAILMAHGLGIHSSTIAKALMTVLPIPGRMEKYELPNKAHVIIDYAHTPDSYTAVLTTVRGLTDHSIVIFGCGGGRDKAKRPLMGAIAAELADVVIITSDNPRTEDIHTIVEDISKGIDKHHKGKVMYELDRKKAIELAYSLSKASSIIMLLGKGPDEHQIIGKEKFYFSEKEIIKQLSSY